MTSRALLPHAALPVAPAASRPALLVAALVAVYVVWGSTYLGMRIALEAWSPFALGAVRFLAAGAVLAGVLAARGEAPPTARQWVGAAVTGVLMLTLGNGLVAVAQESRVDSGVAATVVATMPMWMAVLGVVSGERPSKREIAGLLLGFVGVAILQGGGSLHVGDPGAAVILLAPVTWALGSVLSRRLAMPRGLWGAAAQMLVGGAVMAVVAAARGEGLPATLDARPTLAVAYLVVFGSLVGFSAYAYLLRTTRPAVASSYAYVNPVVALLLGAALAGEGLGLGKLAACLVVIAGVIVVMRRTRG